MNNTTITDQTEDKTFASLTIVEKYEFIGKLVIAAQNGFFGECSEIINNAEVSGLYDRVKPISGNNQQIRDLDNPIN